MKASKNGSKQFVRALASKSMRGHASKKHVTTKASKQIPTMYETKKATKDIVLMLATKEARNQEARNQEARKQASNNSKKASKQTARTLATTETTNRRATGKIQATNRQESSSPFEKM